MNKNEKILDIILYLLLLATLFILTVTMIGLVPLYGVMDYYSETVEWDVIILGCTSFVYISYLILSSILLFMTSKIARIVIPILNLCITFLFGLGIMITTHDISHLISAHGGFQLDRTVALVFTLTVALLILGLTIFEFFISPIKRKVLTD